MTDTGTSNNPLGNLIPRGSLGLKLLLVCLLVLVMGIPLMFVGMLQGERENRARGVTAELGEKFGGTQVVGGPMLLVPYQRQIDVTDDQGKLQRRTERGSFLVSAATGSADANLVIQERRQGIYKAAIYTATTDFKASFTPAEALSDISEDYRLSWRDARIVMFVHDSRVFSEAAELRFGDGATAPLEPVSDITGAAPGQSYPSDGSFTRPRYTEPTNIEVLGAPAPFEAAPQDFTVETRLALTGAQRFSVAAFAQDTAATIRGDRSDARAEGAFNPTEALDPSHEGFVASWRVPYVARGVQKFVDLGAYNIGNVAGRDMAVSFVALDDVYVGVARAVRYGVMFIGVVFLATLIFEAVSGKKAHPAQYILVGLMQCVFYLLLLSLTEIVGFTAAFLLATIPTVAVLAYYAGASFGNAGVGWRSLIGLALLYGAMFVLLTLEDYALLAGSVVAFVVLAATMIATRSIDWYGRSAQKAS